MVDVGLGLLFNSKCGLLLKVEDYYFRGPNPIARWDQQTNKTDASFWPPESVHSDLPL